MEKYTAEFIREKMDTDDKWLVRGLIAIYKKQTAQEKAIRETREKNGVGFNGVDGQIMSSIAEFYMNRQYITPKQTVVVRRKMRKYAGQLARIANSEA